MTQSSRSKNRFTPTQIEEFAKLEIFIRHVRNLAPIGPLRAEAVDANQTLERALGKEYDRIYKTHTWKAI